MRKGTCVEINGIYHHAIRLASNIIGCSRKTIRRRCLSDKFPNYKIVPYRIMHTEKKCTKCGKVKLLNKFDKNKKTSDEHAAECKECHAKRSKEYRKNNHDKIKKYSRTYSRENKILKNTYEKKKKEKDPIYRLNRNISRAMNHCLKGNKNGHPCETLVDYSIKELIAHLESKFTEGMSWGNYGKGKYKWNLDHKIPVCKWDITSIDCQALRDCWALDNLQPLWAIRNLQKGNRPMEPKYLIKPF